MTTTSRPAYTDRQLALLGELDALPTEHVIAFSRIAMLVQDVPDLHAALNAEIAHRARMLTPAPLGFPT